jgi:hypothetical protein
MNTAEMRRGVVRMMTLAMGLALLAGACDVEPSDYQIDGPGADAGSRGPATRRRMACGAGLPTIALADGGLVIASCPAGDKSMKVTVTCQGPPLLAKAEGDELLVLCPEGAVERPAREGARLPE